MNYRNIICTIFVLIVLGASEMIAQDTQTECKQTLQEVSSIEVYQVDTIKVRHPETNKWTHKIVTLYRPGEQKIAKTEKINDLKVFYIKENDCLLIRHTELIKD